MTYALTGTDAAGFSINTSTGVITINNSPDFETKSSYNFNVKASDVAGAFTTQPVTVNVNDLPPVITSSTTANINEGVAATTPVYTAIASDPSGGTVTYSLTGPDAAAFTINSTTGVVTINSVPNYQTKSSYTFTIKASDAFGAFNTVAVTVTVNQVIHASPSNLIGLSFSGNSGFTLQFTNVAGANFTALTSTNLSLSLSNWTVLGTIPEGPTGHYQFNDAQATNNPKRFYSVRSP